MNPIAAVILYLITWFMCLFVILPLRLTSQQEAGKHTPGTPASAPDDPMLKKKLIWVTILATCVWLISVVIIMSHVITLEDIDFFHRL